MNAIHICYRNTADLARIPGNELMQPFTVLSSAQGDLAFISPDKNTALTYCHATLTHRVGKDDLMVPAELPFPQHDYLPVGAAGYDLQAFVLRKNVYYYDDFHSVAADIDRLVFPDSILKVQQRYSMVESASHDLITLMA